MRCPYCGKENIAGIDLCEACGSDLAGLDLPEAGKGPHGRLLSDRIGDLQLEPALSLPPSAAVIEAINLMRGVRHGSLAVHLKDRILGIFTERDVLSRIVIPGLDPESTTLEKVMTPDPVVLSPDDPPAYAAHLMVALGFRHAPVADDAGVIGFLSVRSLLLYLQQHVLTGGSGAA